MITRPWYTRVARLKPIDNIVNRVTMDLETVANDRKEIKAMREPALRLKLPANKLGSERVAQFCLVLTIASTIHIMA